MCVCVCVCVCVANLLVYLTTVRRVEVSTDQML
jgi:hypothetical protein